MPMVDIRITKLDNMREFDMDSKDLGQEANLINKDRTILNHSNRFRVKLNQI